MKTDVVKVRWYYGLSMTMVFILTPLIFFLPKQKSALQNPHATIKKVHRHFDHSKLFNHSFDSPQEVTVACLQCHEDAAHEVMNTAHWTWERSVQMPERDLELKVGKINLINNFCIGIQGNEAACASCHAGYGWSFNEKIPTTQESVDCLVCHDRSGGYSKGPKGLPKKGVNLQLSAQSVGYPTRENCGSCHMYGGGGMGVKHGDLDSSLVNPSDVVDVHMGKHNLLCIDCHQSEKHQIKGQAYSVSVVHNQNALSCTDCHAQQPHQNERLNLHGEAIACQTCHIPSYARKAPTKMWWDWSKAGEENRPANRFVYQKIKGEYVYEQNIVPEYAWFNRSVDRYLLGDKINPNEETGLNDPRGDIYDPTAKIWPFKVHRGKQPYDKNFRYLMAPVTAGAGGYWKEFDWDKALALSQKTTGLKYSGDYGFALTRMHWPLSHMVVSKEQTLQCADCHGENAQLFDWQALGYSGDPAEVGGRKTQRLVHSHQDKEGVRK